MTTTQSPTDRAARLNRRQTLALGASGLALAAAAATGLPRPAAAQTRVTVDEANLKPRPIAIPPFLSADPRLGNDVAQIVAADLERSGLFKPLERAAFIEQVRSLGIRQRWQLDVGGSIRGHLRRPHSVAALRRRDRFDAAAGW